MKINTDINVLGGLPDLNLIPLFLDESTESLDKKSGAHSYTSIKTNKSIVEFERVIKKSVLTFKNKESEFLLRSILSKELISESSLHYLFWHTSVNNDLLNYLNERVYFIAFYSGRISIRKEEIAACLMDLKESEETLQKWSDSTIDTTASKYLTLLKKFGLMEGGLNKTILHPYLNDRMLIIFVYWLMATETKANLLESTWLKYCFSEKQVFIERIAQKKFAKFVNLYYSGDKLKIEPVLPYTEIYDALTRS
jgi:hypothetical protein